MPLTDRSQAKDSGFAQVRAALQKFKGTVASAEFDRWGGQLIDEDTGKPIPPKEFLEVSCTDVQVLEVTEELSMPIEEWNFRINCSEFKGSFWVEKFLESADKFKILIPDGLVGKIVTWERVTLESVDKNGVRQPKYDSTNFVVAAIEGAAVAPTPKPTVVAKPATTSPAILPAQTEEVPAEATPDVVDAMAVALELAVDKTEAQFRTAITLDPRLAGNPLLPLAKAGTVTQALVNEGKLVLGADKKYHLPS